MQELRCEYCNRQIKNEPEIRVRRGIKHVYCSEFCYRLHFYGVPRITYEDLQKMYELRTISVKLEV
uniref:TRASH domain-containing protein n=1 Tax=candidate division WOR-3 bacterium TaxID=2052148 RepID=A0A7C2P4G2_UNCW3